MARIPFFHWRSSSVNLVRIIFIVAYFLTIANASVHPVMKRLAIRQYFSPLNWFCDLNDAAATDCKGETDCVYPNPVDCHSYIKCNVTTVTPLWFGINSLVEAQKKNCSTGQEFSIKTKTCQPAGALGTCSENNQTHTPSRRAEDPAIPEQRQDGQSAVDALFCQTVVDLSSGCLGKTDCVYPNPANHYSYIKCVTNSARKTGTASLISCSGGSEYNPVTRKCEWRGAPGTRNEPYPRMYHVPKGLLERATEDFKCPKINQTLYEEDPNAYVFPLPGRCDQSVQCAPEGVNPNQQFPEGQYLLTCLLGRYWDSKLKKCRPLTGPNVESTCEVNKRFKCPRRAAFREDCEQVEIGHLCRSSKGQDWYIGCFTGFGNTKAYELRCPPGEEFDLDFLGGPGCYKFTSTRTEDPSGVEGLPWTGENAWRMDY